MERRQLACLGISFVLAILSGCVQPPSPQVSVAPVAAAPAPVSLVQPVWVSAPQLDVPLKIAHPAIHHRSARGYYRLQAYHEMAQCGSDVHPCSVSHVVLPIQ
jgi:hypothetical protein